ncbi:MAG: tetratricopeptide repeat protein [Desulfonatronovibrio sp.]
MLNKFLILFFLVLSAAPGCAPKQEPATAPHQWELSSEATVTYYYLKAQDKHSQGRFLEAAALLERAVEAGPKPYLYIDMARSYWRGRDRDMAVKSMKEAVSAFPEEPDVYFVLAELYLADNNESKALEVIDQFSRIAPDHPDVYQDLASFYHETGDYPKVLDLLQQVPDEDKTPEMLYHMGRASYELGDIKKAVRFLRRAVDKKPMFVQGWAELAFIFERERDYVQAEEIYEKLYSIGETNPDLILRIIELNLKLNDPDKARRFLDKGPNDLQFHLDAAKQFINNSFYDHAYDILSKITRRSSYPPTVFFYMALVAYEGWSDPDRALEYLQYVPEDDPYHVQALLFSIEIHFEQKQYRQALELTRQGSNIHPDESRFVLFESVILEILGEYSRALEAVDSGLKKWPSNTDLHFRKGVLLDKKGKKDQALETMEDIVAMDQDHHEALNYVGYTLAEQDRDLDRALVLIKRALKLDPGNGYYMDSLAWTYYVRGEYEKAWKEISRAVEFAADDPIIWEHYADIALAVNNPEQALRGYETALEMDPDDLDEIQKKIKKLLDKYPELQNRDES